MSNETHIIKTMNRKMLKRTSLLTKELKNILLEYGKYDGVSFPKVTKIALERQYVDMDVDNLILIKGGKKIINGSAIIRRLLQLKRFTLCKTSTLERKNMNLFAHSWSFDYKSWECKISEGENIDCKGWLRFKNLSGIIRINEPMSIGKVMFCWNLKEDEKFYQLIGKIGRTERNETTYDVRVKEIKGCNNFVLLSKGCKDHLNLRKGEEDKLIVWERILNMTADMKGHLNGELTQKKQIMVCMMSYLMIKSH